MFVGISVASHHLQQGLVFYLVYQPSVCFIKIAFDSIKEGRGKIPYPLCVRGLVGRFKPF